MLRIVVPVACLVLACTPRSAVLDAFDTRLCSGGSLYEQIGIDVDTRLYGMFDFQSAFIYCSTPDYHCMKAPLLISFPRGSSEAPAELAWEIEGIPFTYERDADGIRIKAVTPPDALIPGTGVTSTFAANGDLIEVVHRMPDGNVEVQRVCRGNINVDDLFDRARP